MTNARANEVAQKFFNPTRNSDVLDHSGFMGGCKWQRWAYFLSAKQWNWLYNVSDVRFNKHSTRYTEGQFTLDGKTYFYTAHSNSNGSGYIEYKVKIG